jgi:hypothetical protein
LTYQSRSSLSLGLHMSHLWRPSLDKCKSTCLINIDIFKACYHGLTRVSTLVFTCLICWDFHAYLVFTFYFLLLFFFSFLLVFSSSFLLLVFRPLFLLFLSFWLSLFLSFCLSFFPSFCLPVFLSFYLSAWKYGIPFSFVYYANGIAKGGREQKKNVNWNWEFELESIFYSFFWRWGLLEQVSRLRG